MNSWRYDNDAFASELKETGSFECVMCFMVFMIFVLHHLFIIPASFSLALDS